MSFIVFTGMNKLVFLYCHLSDTSIHGWHGSYLGGRSCSNQEMRFSDGPPFYPLYQLWYGDCVWVAMPVIRESTAPSPVHLKCKHKLLMAIMSVKNQLSSLKKKRGTILCRFAAVALFKLTFYKVQFSRSKIIKNNRTVSCSWWLV